MENLLKILIILLLIIILILLSTIIAGIIFLYRKHFFSLSRKEKRLELNCHNHPQVPSAGSCAICSDHFCEACLKEHEKLHFCSIHYQLFLDSEWEEIENVKTTPEEPEKAMHLYNHKDKWWSLSQIPSYIMTHYKIDVDNDQIESHVKLFTRKQEAAQLKKELNQGDS